MAFDIQGLNDFAQKISSVASDDKTIVKRLLEASYPQIEKLWEDTLKQNIMPRGTQKTYGRIRKSGKVYRQKYVTKSTGQTVESVSTTVRKSYADIYPHGEDAKGTRYAEKAFILNYGRKNMIATNFIDGISDKAVEVAVPLMEEEFNKILNEKGLV